MLEKQVEALSDKVDKLGSKVDKLNINQAVIGSSLEKVAESLGILAKLRAETVKILNQCDVNDKEHDEIFTRLRESDKIQSICATKHVSHEKAIGDLQSDRRWIAYTIIGAVFLGLVTLLLNTNTVAPTYIHESKSKQKVLQQ